MNIESEFGKVTNDVLGAISDAVTSNISVLLRSETQLSDEQIQRVTSVAKATVESVGFRGVNQYVAVHNSLSKR
jgi:hypothetical protein